MKDVLPCRNALGVFAWGVTRVHVAVEAGEVAARDIQANTVTAMENLTHIAHIDCVLIDDTRVYQLRFEDGPSIARPYDALGNIVRAAIRVNIDKLDSEVSVPCRS